MSLNSNRARCPARASDTESGLEGAGSAALRARLPGLLPDLRAFARFLLRDTARADDLVQDTLVRALAALDQFRPDTNLKAWLFTIQRNAFYEQARRHRRESAALARQPPVTEEDRPGRQTARNELSDLQRLLWTLPATQREALVLVGVQELDYDAAAAICGVPAGTVKARVSRARARLARATAEQAGPS